MEKIMEKIFKKTLLLSGTALIGAVALSVTALADVSMPVTATLTQTFTEAVTTDMTFGTIGVDPTGDTITIDASLGSAVAVATGGSDVSAADSTSGLITITSSITTDVTPSYDATATLTDPGSSDTVTVSLISANSTPAYTHDGPTGTSEIHVGGVLTIVGTETFAGAIYAGSIAVAIAYN